NVQRTANSCVVQSNYVVAKAIVQQLRWLAMTPRILIADDDEGLRHLLQLVLRHEGFEVIEAADGIEALARAYDSNPTLVLLDVMMPGVDGYDVCRKLRSDQRTHRMPIVFVTAIDDITQRNESLKLGADDCIKKPIGPRELIARVREVLDRRGLAWAA
ncbi:MAG TPA: response regulator, partial [Anaerolineae bacterium]|nr:response regulator [Anaerolineae bacterium]